MPPDVIRPDADPSGSRMDEVVTDHVGASASPSAALLDRDGVINVDEGYTYRPESLRLTPTAAEGIKLLNKAGHLVIVVTNQSGVARGLYGIADVDRFHEKLQEMLRAEGAHIDAFYHCPYHPDGSVAEYAIDHEDRKPRPGMLIRAMQDWNVDRERSFMIGDSQSDLESATAAGIRCLLVPKNHGDLAAAVRKMLAA